MKIVIDIPCDTYEYILKCTETSMDEATVIDAIRHGTTLPVGHDALIYKTDAISVIEQRNAELMKDSVYRNKHGHIDVLGIIPYIRDLVPRIPSD